MDDERLFVIRKDDPLGMSMSALFMHRAPLHLVLPSEDATSTSTTSMASSTVTMSNMMPRWTRQVCESETRRREEIDRLNTDKYRML
jgi:hypothetical protein